MAYIKSCLNCQRLISTAPCFRKKKSRKQIRVEGVPPSNRGQDARDTLFPKVCLTSILQNPTIEYSFIAWIKLDFLALLAAYK